MNAADWSGLRDSFKTPLDENNASAPVRVLMSDSAAYADSIRKTALARLDISGLLMPGPTVLAAGYARDSPPVFESKIITSDDSLWTAAQLDPARPAPTIIVSNKLFTIY